MSPMVGAKTPSSKHAPVLLSKVPAVVPTHHHGVERLGTQRGEDGGRCRARGARGPRSGDRAPGVAVRAPEVERELDAAAAARHGR